MNNRGVRKCVKYVRICVRPEGSAEGKPRMVFTDVKQ